MTRAAVLRGLALVFLALTAVSCVRVVKQREPLTKAHLFITRTHQETRLTWLSDPNVTYTVMVQPKRKGGIWKPLPGAINMRGTGKEMTVADAPERGIAKRYRLHIVPLMPGKH